MLDGDPTNNFLKRALAFNPEGALKGARRIAIVGTYAYILCDAGLAVVSLDNPLKPALVAQVGAPFLVEPRGIAVQFRYAFVVDREGLKVLDITHLDQSSPASGRRSSAGRRSQCVCRAHLRLRIAAGKQGLAIVDMEHPEQPKLDQIFNADGAMNDVNDVKLGMVSSELFAYVADGRNGLRVIQLFSPADNPDFSGFSPRPTPKLIATRPHARTSAGCLQRASIAIAAWMRAAIRWPCSGAAARVRSIMRKCSACICATANSTPSQTVHPSGALISVAIVMRLPVIVGSCNVPLMGLLLSNRDKHGTRNNGRWRHRAAGRHLRWQLRQDAIPGSRMSAVWRLSGVRSWHAVQVKKRWES